MALEDIDVQSFVQALGVPTQEALAALEQIQREPAAWQLAFDLLGSDNANCRFFGAHTLQTKIGRDWETLDEERRQALRHELIRVVVESSGAPQNVLSKVNQGLAMYALRTVPDEWENFLPTAMEAIRQRGRETGKGAGQTEMAIVDLLTQFPEELNRTAIASAQHGRLVQDVRAAVPVVLEMLTGVACGTEAWQAGADPVHSGAWRTRAWRAVQQWLQFGVAGDGQFVGLLEVTLQRMHALAAQRAAGDAAAEEEEEAAAAVAEDMVGNVRMAAQIGHSVGMAVVEQLGQPWARQAVAGSGEAAAAWAGVLAAFGETYAEFLVERAGADGRVDAYLETMVELTRMTGTAGVDEQVSVQALGVWYAIQEAAEGAPSAAVVGVLGDVAQRLVTKSAFPAAAAWTAAGREGRERFHAFRREAGDGLLNAYYVLRGALVGALAEEAMQRMAGLTLDAWQGAEAALFALRSVGEAAAADAASAVEGTDEGAAHDSPAASAAHLSRFFTAEMVGSQFVSVLQTPASGERAAQWGVATTKAAVVALVGAYAEWWRAQPQMLPAAVACVASALAQPPLVQPAAAALRRICDACRAPLTAVANDLAALARDVAAAAVPPREQQRVVEAVAEVVATVPPPALPPTLAPLAAALADSVAAAAACVDTLTVDERPNAVAALADRLRLVDALARGLQPPDDVEARALAGDVDALAVLTLAAQCYTAPTLRDCRTGLLVALHRVPLTDITLLECVLAIVASATRRGPHALAFAFADAVALVDAGWDGCWDPRWNGRLDSRWDERCPPLLRSVAQLATVFAEPAAWHGAPPDAPRVLATLVARAVKVTCTGLECEAVAAAAACERQPLVCEGLLELGARVVLPRPVLLAEVPHACMAQLCALTTHALAVPNRLALRPAALFASTLTRLAATTSRADSLHALWTEFAPAWLRATLLAIGDTHPRSLLPALAELLFAFLRHHSADTRRCLTDLLAVPDFPSSHADEAAKRQLLKLLATRSLVRAKAAVADFSARCRNLDAP